jgi:molybdopterin-biosynthesis enzyme MoeA-like protein
MLQVQTVIKTTAEELGLSQDDLVLQGLRQFLERQLRETQAQIFQITGSYNVRGVEEMENRYRSGELEEATSWRDLQRLDHLEYKRDRLLKLLENLP